MTNTKTIPDMRDAECAQDVDGKWLMRQKCAEIEGERLKSETRCLRSALKWDVGTVKRDNWRRPETAAAEGPQGHAAEGGARRSRPDRAGGFLCGVDMGLRSSDSLQPRRTHWGLTALARLRLRPPSDMRDYARPLHPP